MSVKAPCLGIGFRRDAPRPAWAAPIASGRFAFLEMSDRRAMRARARETPAPSLIPTDDHREPSRQLLAAWAPVERELRQAVDESTYRIWLADVHPHSLVGGTWTLACPRPETVGWIADRFGRVFRDCAGCAVMFVACEAAT